MDRKNNLRNSGMGLVLASGIIETVVSFIAYFVFYFGFKEQTTAMVLLLGGMLGGILAIIGSILIKSTRLGGPILSLVAACMQLFATVYLIIVTSTAQGDTTGIMVLLPFFILPNALAISGATMAILPQKDMIGNQQVQPAPQPQQVEEKKPE